MRFFNRLKIYFVKTRAGGIAECPVTGNPLMAPYTREYKKKLKVILKEIKEEYPDYNKCKIKRLREF